MKWVNLVGAAGVLLVITAVRLQDKFIYQNTKEREASSKAAESK